MLTFDFTFKPFDLSGCYHMYAEQYSWGWITKMDLVNDVQQGLLPATEYKKITGDDYEAPKSVSK